jgi:trimethylamine--corrinoid protein Co-methyltransferase
LKPILEFLSTDEVYAIHQASLEILERVGMKFESSEAQQILKSAGIDVDSKGVARFHSSTVEDYIKKAPRSVVLRGRDPKKDVFLRNDRVTFAAGTGMYVIEGNKARKSTYQDCCNWARLTDAMKNLDFTCEIHSTDMPSELTDRYNFKAMAMNTTKPFVGSSLSRAGIIDEIEMAAAIVGGKEELRKRPIWWAGYAAISPLTWSENACTVFKETSPYNIPAFVEGESVVGGTSAVTVASTLAQTNAEALSGIVYCQILNKGRPCILNLGFTHPMDMKTCLALHGNVVSGIVAAGGTQLARFYGLPSAAWMATDSKVSDAQCGYEKALTGIIPALARSSLIFGMGQAEFTFAVDFEKLVIDDEIVAQMRRILDGIDVTEETLCLDSIERVGIGGNFLSSKARDTFKFIPKETTQLTVGDRNTREKWLEAGGNDIGAHAREKVKEILATHEPESLDQDIVKKLDAIIENAKRNLARKT